MTNQQITTIHSLIRDSRQGKYRTAKEFWEQNQEALKVSYPHYSAVEKGTKFPDIGLTISIAKTLKIELRLVCHLWAKDQMPDAETRAYFEPVPGAEKHGIPSTVRMQLDEFYVFTEKQVSAFRNLPHLWDVLMVIMSFSEVVPLTEKGIAEAMDFDFEKVQEATEWLRNEGLIYADKGHLKARRRFYHLPNTESFKEIRDQNFRNATKDIIKKLRPEELSAKEAYRTTFTRRITRMQAVEICKHIDDLVGHLGNLPDMGNELYSLAIAFSPRAKFQSKSEVKQKTPK